MKAWSTSSRASPACRGRSRRDVDLAGLVRETVQLYRGVKPGVEVASDGRRRGARTPGSTPSSCAARSSTCSTTRSRPPTPPGRVDVRTARSDGRRAAGRSPTAAAASRAEAKEKLFLPYFSTKGRGTGLGLAIVHRIVTDHHGTIRVEDNPPRGTVFTIELPAR